MQLAVYLKNIADIITRTMASLDLNPALLTALSGATGAVTAATGTVTGAAGVGKRSVQLTQQIVDKRE